MGNQHSAAMNSLHSTQSSGIISMLPPRQNKPCRIEFPVQSQHSISSSDSDSNNDQIFAHLSQMHESSVILQSANQKVLPMKVRKISRAASANRLSRRRHRSILNVLGSKPQTMDEDARLALCEQWSIILALYKGDTSRLGVALYQRFFNAEPKLREVFCIPELVDNLYGYEPFKRHGKLLASVLDLCVRNIHSLDVEMGPVLVMYGRRHYHRQCRGFRISYISVFTKCMNEFIDESLNTDEKTSKTEQSWHMLFDYIAGKIIEGVHLESQRTQSLRRKSIV